MRFSCVIISLFLLLISLHANASEIKISSDEILLVIDMQRNFCAANDEVLCQCIENEIDEARNQKRIIIFIEFEGYGPTIASLLRRSEGYAGQWLLTKSTTSGADCVIAFLKELASGTAKRLRICGVNTGFCVGFTARELCQNDMVEQVIVIGRACRHAQSPSEHQRHLQILMQYDNDKLKVEVEGLS